MQVDYTAKINLFNQNTQSYMGAVEIKGEVKFWNRDMPVGHRLDLRIFIKPLQNIVSEKGR